MKKLIGCLAVVTLSALVAFAGDVERVKYALAFGRVATPIDHFVPGSYFLSNIVQAASVPSGDAALDSALYANYVTAERACYVGRTNILIRLDRLQAGTQYNVRLHSVEPSHDAAGKRVFDVYVNGGAEPVLAGCDPFAVAGVKCRPAVFEFAATADENGAIFVNLDSRVDLAVACGIEVIAPENADAEVPPLVVNGFREFVQLCVDDRSYAHTYDVEYKVGENGTPVLFAKGVKGVALYDMDSVGSADERYYRARFTRADDGAAWSDWVKADRSVSAERTVRMSCDRGGAQYVLADWTSDQAFRHPNFQDNSFRVETKALANIDMSKVKNAGPAALYGCVGKNVMHTNYWFRFTDMNPYCTYRLRLHVMETYFNPSATWSGRQFYLAAQNMPVIDWAAPDMLAGVQSLGMKDGLISVSHITGGTNIAGVIEATVKVQPNGILDLGVYNYKDWAQIAGIELIPLGEVVPQSASVKSIVRSRASDDDVHTTNEYEVATLDKNALSWTSAELPETCTGDNAPVRILTTGNLFLPKVTANMKLVIEGTDRVFFWMDEAKYAVSNSVVNGVRVVTTNDFTFAAGIHPFYVEVLQVGTEVDATVKIIGDAGEVAYSFVPCEYDASIAPWRLQRLHGLGGRYNNLSPSYVIPLNAEKSAYRLYGSGYDAWATSEGGSFMYNVATGQFQVVMRVLGYGGTYVSNTRLGLSMRGDLTHTKSARFSVVGGFHPRNYLAPAVYGCGEFTNQFDYDHPDNTAWLNPTTSDYYALPLWLRMTRENGENGKYRFKMEYSRDGENWDLKVSTNMVRTKTAYVGPMVVAHDGSKDKLTWMEFDNLEIIDLNQYGSVIIFR